MGHYASEMSGSWGDSLRRSDRLDVLRRAFEHRPFTMFEAKDLVWLVPLLQGYPQDECLHEEILLELEHRVEINGLWARQDYGKYKRKGKRG